MTRALSPRDKLHNVRTILTDYRNDGDTIWLRFNGKREGTLWYYRALMMSMRGKPQSHHARNFKIAVGELERLCGEIPSGGGSRPRQGEAKDGAKAPSAHNDQF